MISSGDLIAPELLTRIERVAQAEARFAKELVTEALEDFLSKHEAPQTSGQTLSATQAAAKILELRKGNRLPPGVSLQDLIDHGRA